MASTNETMQIRSFRVCFELERRLHRIDRWRLPFPHGIPLRGLGYAVAVLLGVLVIGGLPILGAAVGVLHPLVRYVALPVGAGYLLARWKVDGRPAPGAWLAWLRTRLTARRLCAFRAAPPAQRIELAPIAVAPDERGARYRRGVVEGPATLIFRYPVEFTQRGDELRLRPEAGGPLWRGKQVRLRAGQRVVVR